jgi:hypothetical protein
MRRRAWMETMEFAADSTAAASWLESSLSAAVDFVRGGMRALGGGTHARSLMQGQRTIG